MSRYLLDTTTIIDFSKGIEPQASRLSALLDSEAELGVCSVIASEFYSGVSSSDRETWQRFFETLTYWEVPFEVAMRAGMDRYDLARRGIQVSTQDALIAAVARAQGATIITDNVRDFPLGDVQTLSLRDPHHS